MSKTSETPNKIIFNLQAKLDAIADKKVAEGVKQAMQPLWDLIQMYRLGEAWTALKSEGGSSTDVCYVYHHLEETIISTLTPRFRKAESTDFCARISDLSGKSEELKEMLEAMESR